MAVEFERGSWTGGGSTPQTINLANSSLVPMAIIVRVVRSGAVGAGFQASTVFSKGFATRRGGTTQEKCFGFIMVDNVSPGDNARVKNTKLAHVLSSSVATDYTVTLSSFGTGQFTIAYSSAAAANGDVFEYEVIGGLDDAIVIDWTMDSTGATESITGVGFQPDCLLAIDGDLTSDATITQNLVFSFGCATSSSQYWSLAVAATDADTCTSAMNWNRAFRSDACLERLDINLDTSNARWDLDGFTSDGCDLGVVDAPSNTTRIASFLFLKGGAFEAGSKNKSASTGDDVFTLSNSSLTPAGVILGTARASGFATNSTDFCIGSGSTPNATRGSAVNGCVGSTSAENINTTCDRYSATDNVICEPTGGTTPAETSEAHYAAAAAGSFTINWSVNGGSSVPIGFLAVGNQAAPAVSDVPGNAPHRYHRASSIYRTSEVSACL